MEKRILIESAVSGGSLQELLAEAVRKYGAGRLVLSLERLAMDFPLPCHCGCGASLSPAALAALRQRCNARVFYTDALCARYFTYRDGKRVHLVLFDDGETLRRKESLASRLGIEAFVYPAEL